MTSDLNDLDAFVRVVEHGSFTGAARTLRVPVSSVSRKVSRLEEELGTRLLHRTTRSLRLTEAGEIFHERVARSLAEVDEAQKDLLAQGNEPRGLVRMTGPADLTVLSIIVADFLAKYPEVRVDLNLSNRLVDLVTEGYDLAVRAGRMGDANLIAHKLYSGTMMIAATPDYLERSGTPRTASELADHDCIVLANTTAGASWPFRKGRRIEQVPVRARLAVNNVTSARLAVLEGFGLAWLPDSVIREDLAAGRLRQVLSGCGGPTSSAAIVYPSRRLLAPAVRALADHIIDYFQTRGFASAPSVGAEPGLSPLG